MICAKATLAALLLPVAIPAQTSPIRTVFVIVMENHNWSEVSGNPAAPYINGQLLPNASHAEAYFNPPGVHPSLPNYLWLEAGTDFGIRDDGPPSAHHQSTDHFVAQLTKAGIAWKSYQEDIDGTACPLNDQGGYAPRHNPAVYFDDVTGGNDPGSAFCSAHVRPYAEFASDLQNNTVASYNFIGPNLCHDMHDCGVAAGDAWLSAEVPRILNSQAYQNGGALFITWDEGEGNDGPIGMIVLSPSAKGNGYSNTIPYTHSSLLRTLQEIFGVGPLLGDAAAAADLSDLFSAPLTAAAAPQAIVNAASLAPGSLAPGEVVSLFGPGIGPAAPAGPQIDSSGLLGASLGGIRVLFDSVPAPLLFAAPGQINLVVPYEVAGKPSSQVQIENQGQLSSAIVVPIAATAAGVFTQDSSGHGPGVILNQDGSLNSPANPALAGSTVSVFATGGGQINPPAPDGQTSVSAGLVDTVAAAIGGVAVQTVQAVPAPGTVAGVLSVMVTIPPDAPRGDAVPIVVSLGDSSSQPGVTLAIR